MTVRTRIVVPDQVDAWRDGFDHLGEDAVEVAREHWQLATDLFLAKTQQAVHVITADLKTSGTGDTYEDGGTVVGEVGYGNTKVDYAQYEADRGGDHDFLAIGWEQSERTFNRAMPLIWNDIVDRMG